MRTWPQRLATAGDAVWFYLGKLLWPHPLITIYPRWQIDAGQWVSYLPLLAVIVFLSIFWLKRELWSRACFFAFAYFMAALLPVLGLIDNYIFRYSLVFDHFQYLASIGPLALAGDGVGPVFGFYYSEETMAAIEPLCWTAADPRDGELATDLGLRKRRDTLDRYAGQESELLGGLQ